MIEEDQRTGYRSAYLRTTLLDTGLVIVEDHRMGTLKSEPEG